MKKIIIMGVSLCVILFNTGCGQNRDTSAYHASREFLSPIYEDIDGELYLIRRYKTAHPYENAQIMKFNKQTFRWELSKDIKLDNNITIDNTIAFYKVQDNFYLHDAYRKNYTKIDNLNNISTKLSINSEYSVNSVEAINYKNTYQVEEHNITSGLYSLLYTLPDISKINSTLDIFIDTSDYQFFCKPLQNTYVTWDKKSHQCKLVTQKNLDNINYDYNYGYDLELVKKDNWSIKLINENNENYKKVTPLDIKYKDKFYDLNTTSYEKILTKYPYYKKVLGNNSIEKQIYIDSNSNLYLFKDENLVGDRDIIFEYYTKENPAVPQYEQKIAWE